LTLREN